jgi:hypothetical protein
MGIKKLAIFIGTSAGLARTGPRLQVYLRLFGAILVECSDGNSCYERVTSQIRANSAKPLRRRLRNSSLCICYVGVATPSTPITCKVVRLASGS